VPEDQGDVDVSGTQHLQALDRVGIDEVQFDSRVPPVALVRLPRACGLALRGVVDRPRLGRSTSPLGVL
jgi:hypothetical protein